MLTVSVLTANIIGFIFLVKPTYPYMDATSKTMSWQKLQEVEIWVDAFFLVSSYRFTLINPIWLL